MEHLCWLSWQTLAVMYLEDTLATFVLTFSVRMISDTYIVVSCFSPLTFLILESPNTTTPVPTSPDYPDGNEEIALGVGLTLGVVGTTVVAVTVCCIWCACYRKRYATQVTYGYTSCTQLEQKLWQLFLPDSVWCTTEVIQQCLVLQLVDVDTLHVWMIHVWFTLTLRASKRQAIADREAHTLNSSEAFFYEINLHIKESYMY